MMNLRTSAAITMLLILCVFALPSQAGFAGRPINKCKTIDKPGSYKLTRNLTATGDCLVITADYVTINLNGYRILGDGTGHCITDDGNALEGIVIINGTVAGCLDGIHLAIQTPLQIYAAAVSKRGDGSTGVRVEGDEVITGCDDQNPVVTGAVSRCSHIGR